ncbi:hypothetical protein Tco_0672205 [Tanacetum coccineum]
MLSETLRCILNIEDSHGPSVAMHNLQATQSGKTLFKNSRRFTHFYDFLTPELVDIEKVALSSSLRSLKSKGTLSLDAKSHPLISWNLFTLIGALEFFKKILLKLNLSDHRLFKDGGGGSLIPAGSQIHRHAHTRPKKHKDIMKAHSTYIQDFRTLIPYVFLEVNELFKVKEVQRSFCHSDTEVTLIPHNGMSMSVQKSQVHKMAKLQDGVKRLCLVDDLKMLKITMSNTSSRNKLNPEINDHYNIFTRESQKDELKTKRQSIVC